MYTVKIGLKSLEDVGFEKEKQQKAMLVLGALKETVEKKSLKIENFINYSDGELKGVLKKILDGNEIFDWQDFHDRICEFNDLDWNKTIFLNMKKSNILIKNEKGIYICKTLDKTIIRKSLEQEILKRVHNVGCFLVEHSIYCYTPLFFEMNDGIKYVWVFEKSEEVREMLVYLLDLFKEIIGKIKKRKEIINSFFEVEEMIDVYTNTTLNIEKIELDSSNSNDDSGVI